MELAARAANFCLLAGAAVLVPGVARGEWWREWRAELWQARHEFAYTGRFSWSAEAAIASFCLGAYKDALCLRRLNRKARTPFAFQFGSAWQCLLLLCFLLAASYALMRLLPGVSIERSLSRSLVRPGLVLIEDVNNDETLPTISARQYRAWRASKQEFFDGFAFYRVTKQNVSWNALEMGSRAGSGWGVAQASANLFSLLGLPVRFAVTDSGTPSGIPAVVLSERVWKREFGANQHIAGSVLWLGSRQAIIAGVAPEGPWGLPGKVDAWLLEPDIQTASSGSGYVIAHLSPSGKTRMRGPQIAIQSFAPHRTPDDLLGIAIGGKMPLPWQVFLFASILGFLALPAISSVSLHDLSVSVDEIPWVRRIWRWGFLAAKIALLLPIVYCASLDVAYGYTGFNPYQAVYAQLVVTFFGCLFGASWALSDQRQRCPVCLRRVVHPARVGQFSRTFLAWSGTEMMCMGGHTLLHVPSLPTSWFSTQRWMFLDPSWKFLFAAPARESQLMDLQC
jgi:hypothetical protein